MRIDPLTLGAKDAYRLITGIVVPRPVAWVSTMSAAGVANLSTEDFVVHIADRVTLEAFPCG